MPEFVFVHSSLRRSSLRLLVRLLLAMGASLLMLPVGAKAQVTINFWDQIWGPPEYIDTARKLVDVFNGEHPKIQVKYRSIPWSNWYQTYATAIASGTAPDISTGAGYQAVQFAGIGAIRPMDDVVAELKQSGDLADFFPGSVDRLRFDGHYVALPWNLDLRVWFYRKDLFAAASLKPPTTWAEFRAAAKQLTKDGKFGVVGSGDTGGMHYVLSLILNNGGGLFTETRDLDVNGDRNREALAFYSDLVKDGSVHPASAGYDSDQRRRAFLQGQAAMMLDGPGFLDTAPADQRDKFGMLEPLTGPHGDKGTVLWVNNIMIYDQTKYPEETKTFLKWWSQNQKPLWTEGHVRSLPARLSIAKDPFFTQSEVRRIAIDDYVPVGKATGNASASIFPKLNAVEGDGVLQSLTQELLQGKDVGAAMAHADDKLKAIMKE
ncbi:carbohydrate ABC transporter substrate-binding protein, CUT1 family [Rhizobiales bacterium GAS188]|nr:carbohydrate ABC transporter substrate-binding protein, CUT1 family [Rhizobiales bacterium GAS188]